MKDTERATGKTQIASAEGLLRELLADGPKRPRDVTAVAEERGIRIEEQAWRLARQRVGASAERLGGNRWLWSLPSAGDLDGFEQQLRAWLTTPHGRFAVFVAERDRLLGATWRAQSPTCEQALCRRDSRPCASAATTTEVERGELMSNSGPSATQVSGLPPLQGGPSCGERLANGAVDWGSLGRACSQQLGR
jgi:hypothetical protein